LHNVLHGEPGDGGPLGDAERMAYQQVIDRNARELAGLIHRDDVVVLHDPQTAGLVGPLKALGAVVVWRSHVGAETSNEFVQRGWAFLRPLVADADAYVFSRHAYVPEELAGDRAEVIQPSIDPLSPKNQDLSPETTQAILRHVGLVVDGKENVNLARFRRFDGSTGQVSRCCDVQSTGPPPDFDTPIVTQVSRWDGLKDPLGVMRGFAEHVVGQSDAHLILAGPTVHSVADDTEEQQVLDEVTRAWRNLPHAQRGRVHLACLPMGDVEENAAIVNALQRHAAVVVQKSLHEGFGLTVTEAMWKARPVVASAVGAIRDQIEDGQSGLLLSDPRDLPAFGRLLLGILSDPERARRMGQQARERVRRKFLVTRHLSQFTRLLERLIR
jgi:trehalose synthase